MKVLSVVQGLDPARGGMATAAANMLLAAQQAGVEGVVAVPARRGPGATSSHALMDMLTAAGVVVRIMPPMSWPPKQAYRWGISPNQIAWVARHASDYDVVHVHGVWGMSSVGSLVAGRVAGKPVVVTAHESLTTFDIDGSRSAARRRQKLLLKSLYLRHTALFVLTSELEVRYSLPQTARQRTVYYPVVDAASELPKLRPRGLARELRVGFLGRIDPKKNLDLLISATAQMPSHVRLVIAGTGPPEMVDSLRMLADQLGVAQRIEWLGFVEPGDRADLLAGLDLLAMPSAFESFGLSAAEAMQHGVPVLVSSDTGIAEVVLQRGGGCVTQPDVPAIAKAIGALDTQRSVLGRMGADGQAAVVELLSYARIGKALRDAYSEACDSPHPHNRSSGAWRRP